MSQSSLYISFYPIYNFPRSSVSRDIYQISNKAAQRETGDLALLVAHRVIALHADFSPEVA